MAGMSAHTKYQRSYFLPPEPCFDWVRRDHVGFAPTWCSVDLRDGNQALVVPMGLDEKLEFFQMLVDIGFKEIEVGFPAASDTEFDFCRALIERGLIPPDVTIQVLTQAREHIIRRTFEAVAGCTSPVIVHVYNSVSKAQREQVYHASRDEVKRIAVEGAKLLSHLAAKAQAAASQPAASIAEGGVGVASEAALANVAPKVVGALPERPQTRVDGHSESAPAKMTWQSAQDRETPVGAPFPASAEGTSVASPAASTTEGGVPQFQFEYSPESFTATEPEYALEVCNAVLDVWQPTPERKAIINLPATVETSSPHVYAQQVEFMHKHLAYREAVTLSLHPHNDRGTGVACAELGLLAGAERVEGTLFGNGERTGNVDVITLAMNLFSQGVDPRLDFHDLPRIVAAYEHVTGMEVEARRPYAGQLVFAAFSGGHQDAIAKGLAWREMNDPEHWTCPYLPIDPADVSRRYEADIIRINSQSGKGGVGFVLEKAYGYQLPRGLREEMGRLVTGASDAGHRELSADDVYALFDREFVNRVDGVKLLDFHFSHSADNTMFTMSALFDIDGETSSVFGQGNGRLSSAVDALRKVGIDVHVEAYSEHALDEGSLSRAAAYVGISSADGAIVWGVGEHHDIVTASIRGLISAVNRKLCASSGQG